MTNLVYHRVMEKEAPQFVKETAEQIKKYAAERNWVRQEIAALQGRLEALTALIEASHRYLESTGYKLSALDDDNNNKTVSIMMTIPYGKKSHDIVFDVLKEYPEGLTTSELGKILTERYSNITKKTVSNGVFLLKERGKIKKDGGKWVVIK